MLVIINGPEDGAEFPLVRTPVYIGHGPDCQAHVRLDTAIQPRHAMVTAVSDGYRVRAAGGPGVFVDGKRAGYIRSRILRPGGRLQVGHTQFTVQLAPDGLAKRSRGLRFENDFVWAVRQGFTGLARTAGRSVAYFFDRAADWLTRWKVWLAGLTILYLFWPPFHRTVNAGFYRFYANVLQPLWEQIVNLMG